MAKRILDKNKIVDLNDQSSFDQSLVREADEILSSSSDASASTPPHLKTLSPSNLPSTSSKDLVRFDPLQSYLQEIKHFPVLSREEEKELATKYKRDGDRNAALQLIVSNLKLVVMIAREHQRNVQNILDLVQEGNIGLLDAVEKYDPTRGIRFPSYAVYWIRAYILRYLIANIRLVKVGTTQAQRKLFFNLVKEREKLEKEGFSPEAKLLANRLGVKESEVIEMEQRMQLPDLSVDAPVGQGEGESFDLHSVLPDQEPDVESQVIDADYQQSIREVIDEYLLTAEEKEKALIQRRLFTDEPETLQAIASDFGVSRERMRQIEARLKERLKVKMSPKLDLEGIEGV